MGPGASKWSQAKSDDNSAMDTALRCAIQFGTVATSSLIPTGTRKNNPSWLRMTYFLRCGRRWVLMGPGADKCKWRQAKSDGNSAMTRLHKVQSSLELLQHHLSYQQGQGTIDFDGCMSYFLRCGRRWVLMGPGAGKWSQAKSDGNSAMTRLPMFGSVATSWQVESQEGNQMAIRP